MIDRRSNITKTPFGIFLLFILVLSTFACAGAGKSEPPGARAPNIIFILADDLGYSDINSFDPQHRRYYETPNIDRLAGKGMKFVQAYTSAANCAPTRAALMSGQYYPNQPVYHVGTSGPGRMIPAPNAEALPLDKVTIAEKLDEAGYRTALIGKWHIGNPPEHGPRQQGFAINIGGYGAGNPGAWDNGYMQPNGNPYISDARQGEYLTDYLTRKSIEFITDNKEQPFYLQLSYYSPHSPFQAPKSLVEKYEQKRGDGGHNRPVYAAMIELLDKNVGKLMQAVEELGIAEHTVVIFYSDNGGRGGYDFLGHAENNITSNAPFKGGKGTFYEGGIRVPLIIRWPGIIPPGSQSREPVSSIDFYPTFLDAAGIEGTKYYQVDGLSLLPVMKDPTAVLNRESLFWHFPGYPNSPWRTGPVSVVRSGSWKLMKFYETDEFELYNLKKDPGEQQNLAETYPRKRNSLHRMLQDWLQQTEAPLPAWGEEAN
ncbi:sulfatase [Fodinibius sediminis]|uniref:Arylsulfatase A n=1 Tax=Fodinibius sediminis TaxID=1214077 RepID=A0A521DPH5_9BACT|nr:sulfatase [Fodinibius sediminis]SMO73614.1 Arylsulfatase A [Fodinibius sediminis]